MSLMLFFPHDLGAREALLWIDRNRMRECKRNLLHEELLYTCAERRYRMGMKYSQVPWNSQGIQWVHNNLFLVSHQIQEQLDLPPFFHLQRKLLICIHVALILFGQDRRLSTKFVRSDHTSEGNVYHLCFALILLDLNQLYLPWNLVL